MRDAAAWEIFGLAFLFRLQSAVLGGGGVRSFLKVDILNVMGLSMLATALLWGLARRTATRVVVLVTAAVATAMLTPIVRVDEMARLAAGSDRGVLQSRSPNTAASRCFRGVDSFSLVRRPDCGSIPRVRRATNGVSLSGWHCLDRLLVAAGYALSLLPPIYRETSFWTSSPTFFVLRRGSADCRDPDRLCLDGCGSRPFADSGAWDRLALRLLDSRRDGLRVSDVANPSATRVRAGARRVRRVHRVPLLAGQAEGSGAHRKASNIRLIAIEEDDAEVDRRLRVHDTYLRPFGGRRRSRIREATSCQAGRPEPAVQHRRSRKRATTDRNC